MLGLELSGLARAGLPRGPARPPLARALRHAVRHGRGQLDLLPPRPTVRGRELAAPDAGALHVRREGQPVHDPHEAPARPRGVDEALLPGHRAPGRLAEARAGAVAAAGAGEDRRAAAGVRARRAAPGTPLLRVPPSELVLRRGARPTALPPRRARHRPPPRAALAAARAHRGLDVPALPLRRARPARELLRDGAAGVGLAGARPGRARRGVRVLQQRLGGLCCAERASLAVARGILSPW